MRDVRKIDHRNAALIPGLHQDVAPGNRHQRSVVRHAVFIFRLRRRHLVIGRERQLALVQVENRIRAPVHRIGRAAARLRASAPLIREQNLGARVVEIRGMPERVVRIADRGNAHRIHGIRNVQHDSVAGTCAGRKADRRIDGDVVALVGGRRFLRAFAMVAALPQAVQRAGFLIGKNARAGDDLRLLGMRQRHLDNVDAE